VENEQTLSGITKKYHYVFNAIGEGNAEIDAVLISGIVGQLQIYGKFNIKVYSSQPYEIDYNYRITRSLYIDDALYTVSNLMVMANSLDGLGQIDAVDFGQGSE